jgi:signal peptidase I
MSRLATAGRPAARREPAAAPGPRAYGGHRRRNAALVALLAIVAVGLLFVPLVAEPFRIPSASMAPTIQTGDHVIVDKLAYRDALPTRGELAVFRAPGAGQVTLKRVIGVPGDRVVIEDGVLVVNGRRQREPYADPASIDSEYFGPVTVKAGTVFVLGDNRADSIDSRDFGAVPTDRLIGRVAARVWPPQRWGSPA